MKIVKYILPLLVFLVLMAFLWQGLRKGDPRQLPSVLIGRPLPQFSYPNLLAASAKIDQSAFLGQVSLLNIWATWCVTCQAEHAVLMDIAKSHQVTIYGLDYKDDSTKAQEWLAKYGNPYQAIIADEKGSLAIDFGVYGTPETFIIDAKGTIRYKHIGALSRRVWQDEIEPLVTALKREQQQLR